jgi:hypothetical protein
MAPRFYTGYTYKTARPRSRARGGGGGGALMRALIIVPEMNRGVSPSATKRGEMP